MDPAASVPSLSDSAGYAAMLQEQSRQLQLLTAATDAITEHLQANMPDDTPSPPPALPFELRLAFPDKFNGDPEQCSGFLLQCDLFLRQQPLLYPTEETKVTFVCSLLTGEAREWIAALWTGGALSFQSYAAFTRMLHDVFNHPADGKDPGEQLYGIQQGQQTAAAYSLRFRTLAARTDWTSSTLKIAYREGLTAELQRELACRDVDLDLDQLITLTIRLDNLLRTRQPQNSVMVTATPVSSLPMKASGSNHGSLQLGSTQLTPGERLRRFRENLCLYCGHPGHILNTCPNRHPRRSARPVSDSTLTFTLPVTLCFDGHVVKTQAMIDSGAAGNFIDLAFARTHNVPLLSCNARVAVTALDGRPLGPGCIQFLTPDIQIIAPDHHHEALRLFTIESPRCSIILGLPWLERHDPTIIWSEHRLSFSSTHCQRHCLRPMRGPTDFATIAATTVTETSVTGEAEGLPVFYEDLREAFNKQRATQLPPHRSYDCAIDLLSGAMPTRGRVFPLSQPETAAMQAYIQEELAKGFIRPSTSPASAGFFFVKKKDGGLRPCIDYRSLNDVTVKYRYPLPLVPAALEQLRTARFFTKLDLRSAYNLIRIRAGDEWKTAFSTTSGHYEYLVMPFGLCNAPSVFQAFVNDVFRDLLNKFVIVYIDDILVYSDTLEEHVSHVRQVLQRLIAHRLYAKQEKCEFHQTSISFLGYVISAQGVAMDQGKVDAVLQWPQPKSVRELQRFLGFANFYRRFIRGFSTVAAPLTSLLKGGPRQLHWTPAATQAFENLKSRFSQSPILHHPDPTSQFIVEVDASNTGIGAILSQRHGQPGKTYPCAYYSRKLTDAERNYNVGDRELLAMKAAFGEWRHWLEGASLPFIVLTDHRNLEYIRTAKRLNPRQARWSLFFSRFRFQITYRPGSKNGKADALSRIHDITPDAPADPEPIVPPTLIVAPVQWDIITELAQVNEQHPPPPSCPADRTYVPPSHRQQVLHLVHDTPAAGHPGITATQTLTANLFWWPTLQADVAQHVTQCSTCQRTKTPRRRPAGLLQPLPIPNRPWSHIAVDFVTDLPQSQGNTVILTVVDRFSKACRLIPLPKLPSAMETAEHLLHHVFRFYGLPEDIVSDRGPQFTSRVWRAMCDGLGITISLTSGYHPESNGQAERMNQEVFRFLRTYCHQRQEDSWSGPFQCILGFQPPFFPWAGGPSELPAVDDWFHRSEETWEAAHVQLQHAVRRTQVQADKHRREGPNFSPGQWVWLSTRDLRLRLPCKKLSPRCGAIPDHQAG
uniref:Gypsy retrotransposon integrase-like protein 1 n=1 Tax=Oryzias melastigma TaxID=30732 RepID=A0A3B3BMY4_ORYME